MILLGLVYDMKYNWVCTFDGDKITKVTAYIDSELLNRVVKEHT